MNLSYPSTSTMRPSSKCAPFSISMSDILYLIELFLILISVNEFGPSYAGASAYRNGKSNPNHKVQQRWYLKVKDPEKFVVAFKKFIKSSEKMMGNRWITVKAYTVNNPHGATHSVAMSGENWQELESLRSDILGSKAFINFMNERGQVEDLANIMYRRMRHYNNENNKAKTFDDMW